MEEVRRWQVQYVSKWRGEGAGRDRLRPRAGVQPHFEPAVEGLRVRRRSVQASVCPLGKGMLRCVAGGVVVPTDFVLIASQEV